MNKHFAIVFALFLLAVLPSQRVVRAVEPPKQAGKSPVKVFILAGQSNMEGQGCVDSTGPQGTNPYCLVGQVRNPETRPIFAAITERLLSPSNIVTIPNGPDFWRYKDPAPGNAKDLRIEIRIKGETKVFESHEGDKSIHIEGDPKDMEVISTQYGILRDAARTVDVKPVVEGFIQQARLPKPIWKTFDNVWVYFHTPRGSLTVGQGGGSNSFGPELGFGAVMSKESKEQVLIIKTAWGGMSLNGPFRPPSANNGVGGWAYTNMIREVRECLADLKKNFPSYDGQGYELAGFVWWHGWNDGCEGEKAVKAYESNLVSLIKDVRKDLAAPTLPMVIAGFTGPTVEGGGQWTEIRQAQANVADPVKHPDFKGTVVFVPTHTFVRPPEKSPGGWPCHEYDNPETYFLVGTASGEAMKKLLGLGSKQADAVSLTAFGQYYQIDGSPEKVWRRNFIGPIGAIGSFFGRDILVREVVQGSPADGLLKEGDVIVAADGHELGDDPRVGFGYAVGDVQARDGKLNLDVFRDGLFVNVAVPLPVLGATSANWPLDGGGKSRQLHNTCCEYLRATIATDGQFSARPASTVSGLILLANPDPQYLETARRLAYSYVRHPCWIDGLGAWDCGYTAIYLAEYYMITGDKAVLPELERVCREIARGQTPCGAWGHGSNPSRSYAVGGIVNQTGVGCWIGLIMARNAGVPVDEAALERATAFFTRFVDRSSTPYGDHEPFVGGRSNGKDAALAVAFDLLGNRRMSVLMARYVTDWYSDWEGGHTGDFFSYLWNVLGGLRTPDIQDYLAMMARHVWFFDMARSWEGGGLLNDSVDYNGRGPQFCTGVVNLPFALTTGRSRLSLMGARRSPFCPGTYPKIIEDARKLHFERKWDEVVTLLESQKLSGIDSTNAAWILDAAKAARESVALTLDSAGKNLDSKWDPDLAVRQLEDLKTLLGNADDRVGKLLSQARDKESFKAFYIAQSAFASNQWLVPLDEAARIEMTRLSQDPTAGHYQALAKEQLADKVGTFKFLYEIEGIFYRTGDTSKWDHGQSPTYKLYRRVAESYGGAWPQWVAKDMLRKTGYLCQDAETVRDWAALVPVSNNSVTSKTARVLFMPADGFDHGPAGWAKPEFDDSAWQQAKLPVGSGDNKDIITRMPDDKQAFCARISFPLDDTEFDRLRILFRFRHFANVYLNGCLVSRVLWYGNHGGYGGFYETMELKENATGLLRKGENVLAIEGTWDLWWGIFDAGLYGLKTPGDTHVQPPDARPLSADVAPQITRSDRYCQHDANDAMNEVMGQFAGLSPSQLVGQLSSEWLARRVWASHALAAKGADAMPDIVSALTNKDWRVRGGAYQTLISMGAAARTNAASSTDILVKGLADQETFVQYLAGMALVNIGTIPDAAMPSLKTMLGDQTSWWPRCAAVQMLQKIDARKVDSSLVGLLVKAYAAEPNFQVEEGMRDLIGKWCGEVPGGEILTQVTAALTADNGKDWDRLARLYGIIGMLRGKAKSATPIVEKALQEQASNQERTAFLKDIMGKISATQ